uniref:Fibronectin type-III domain-containing protein n=2 Tax=Parascaris univalens TaxID=6257 RepID=A0A915ADZ8_PARUN
MWSTLSIALLFAVITLCQEYYSEEEETHIEEIDVSNDYIHFTWIVDKSLNKSLTSLRIVAATMKGSSSTSPVAVVIAPNVTAYKFEGLVGNTTYRISVEGFANKRSVFYTSTLISTSLAALDWLPAPTDISLTDKTSDSLEITWTTPIVASASNQAMVNQHLVSAFEFNSVTKISTQRRRFPVRFPNTRIRLEGLQPRTVYNITIQAGTDFGFGSLGWAAFATLGDGEQFILRLKSRTPNSLTVKWPLSWLSAPNVPYTIRAKTLYSIDGSDKEVSVTSYNEPGRSPEYTLRNLAAGAIFNVTMSTHSESTSGNVFGVRTYPSAQSRKVTWAVFSTLQQGEFVVEEPRLAAETDTAASIVWQKIHHQEAVFYQVRYAPNDGGKSSILEPQSEADLECPKVGCDWLCTLVFNLRQRPRDFSFDVRAKVEGIWNKWVPIARRPWNLMERVCTINPPPFFVENIGVTDFMREIDIGSADTFDKNAWKYLIVIDLRGGGDNVMSAIDLSRLNDKATSEYDRIPYYITAGLTPQQVEQRINFKIGDGKVYGGYLNYPLERDANPRWYLIPLSDTENEIMEPTLKSCGFKEDGTVQCDFTMMQLLSYIPWWIGVALASITIFLLVLICLGIISLIRKCICSCSKRRHHSIDMSVNYIHEESPRMSNSRRLSRFNNTSDSRQHNDETIPITQRE